MKSGPDRQHILERERLEVQAVAGGVSAYACLFTGPYVIVCLELAGLMDVSAVAIASVCERDYQKQLQKCEFARANCR